MAIVSNKSNFDVQLQFGDLNQQILIDVFASGDDDLEIKSERANNWSKSGNICIEYAYDRLDLATNERIHAKSGISVTEASHWAQMLMLEDGSYGAMLIFPTDFIRSLVSKWWDTARKVVVNKDGNKSRAYCMLMPLTDVMAELRRSGGYYNAPSTGNMKRFEGREPDKIIPIEKGGASPV